MGGRGSGVGLYRPRFHAIEAEDSIVEKFQGEPWVIEGGPW